MKLQAVHASLTEREVTLLEYVLRSFDTGYGVPTDLEDEFTHGQFFEALYGLEKKLLDQ